MQLLSSIRVLALAGALLGTAACDDDDTPTNPTTAQVMGTYQATTFNATTAVGTQNLLQLGGALTLRLLERGVLTGRLVFPPEDVDEELLGTWRLEGNVVEIDDVPGLDSFISDLDLDVRGNTLVGDEVIEGVRFQVVLMKQ